MIICCGEALIDMVPGENGGFIPLPGGSPYNTAIAIGRLSVPVAFLGRISTDFMGEILINRLRENNVSDSLITRANQNTTLAFVSLEKGEEPQYVFYTNGTADSSLCADDIPPSLPAYTQCLHFGSIAMTMEPIASTIETFILKHQTDESPIISFDPNIRPCMIKNREEYITRFERLTAASVIAKISAADFAYIYPGMELMQALTAILAMGPRLAISTLGHQGAVALLRRNDGNVIRVRVPGTPAIVADTIGAGDTFHGAFLSRLQLKGITRRSLAGLSEAALYDTLLFANKAAAIVCSRRGADPPRAGEV